mmetsp:Transcript_16637/g.40449  ORF Transcript_16637/g.40449 Transcript_16637/m.40449 type:complete len:345 (+) Transcript_16637:42-1076(+)
MSDANSTNGPEQHDNDDDREQVSKQKDHQEQEQRLQEAYDRIADLERKSITLEENNQRLIEKVDQQQTMIEAYEKKLSRLPEMIESILEMERKENAASAAASATVTPSSLASSPSPRSSPAGNANDIPQRPSPPQDLLERSHDQSSFSELRSSIVTNKSKPFFASNFVVRECTPAISPLPKAGEEQEEGNEYDQKLAGGEVRRPRFWKGWGRGSGGSNGGGSNVSNNSGRENRKTDKKSLSSRINSANSYDSHDASRSVRSQGSSAAGASSSSSNHNQKNGAAAAAATVRPSTIITDASAMASIESSELFSTALSLDSARSDNDNRSHNSDAKSNNETMLDLVM